MSFERTFTSEQVYIGTYFLSEKDKAMYTRRIIEQSFLTEDGEMYALENLLRDMHDPYDIDQVQFQHHIQQVFAKLFELKAHNEKFFIFVRNTLLRLFVAHSLELFQLFQQSLHDMAKEFLDKKLITEDLYNYFIELAHFIFMNRSIETEKAIWVRERNQVMLESTALITSALTVGLAPFMMINRGMMDAVPILTKGAVTATEKAGSIARFHNTLKKGSKEHRITKAQYIKKQIKENPEKLGAAVIFFAGAAVASFYIPIVGQIMIGLLALASAAYIGKTIYNSWKASKERKKLLAQHAQDIAAADTALQAIPGVSPPQQTVVVQANQDNEQQKQTNLSAKANAPQTFFQPKPAPNLVNNGVKHQKEPTDFRFRF